MIETLLIAIMMAESGGDCKAIGDGGQSIGPYQIQRAYWVDSRVPGRYPDCRKIGYSRRVVKAYWKRHCPKAYRTCDLKTLAQVHNGGPSGANPKFKKRYAMTSKYWMKVKKKLKMK